MVTIFDVANAAGVSKSTVSLVINNSPLVKKETREKVQRVIRRMNYVPNYNARSLHRKSGSCIGVIHITNNRLDTLDAYQWDSGLKQFSEDIEDGIFQGAMNMDDDISVVKEHFRVSQEAQEAMHPAEKPKLLQSRQVDGAILIGSLSKVNIQKLMEGIHVPVAFITSGLEIPEADTVSHDPARGIYLAAQELLRTGHRNICLLNCPRTFQVWPARVRGLEQAAQEAGYVPDRAMILSPEHNTVESAYLAFSRLLDSGRVPDGVLAGNNEMALGVLRCLYERKLRIPDDVSLICYEDSRLCGSLSPALTAVNIQKERIGRTALEFLMERIREPKLPIRSVTIEPRLIRRDSVKVREI